jgi:hypothetical protein
VNDPSPLLDRAGIEDAFRRLGERLARRGVVADLYVFGGAAMALAYDSRRATRDVDALFKPHGIVHDEALAVAAELGLPRWWLNEQASSYVAPGGDPAASRVFDHPGLRVFAASPEHLLAMKAFAARPRDAEDIRQLVQVLDLHTVDEVLAVVREIFPEEEPPERLRLLLEDIFLKPGPGPADESGRNAGEPRSLPAAWVARSARPTTHLAGKLHLPLRDSGTSDPQPAAGTSLT